MRWGWGGEMTFGEPSSPGIFTGRVGVWDVCRWDVVKWDMPWSTKSKWISNQQNNNIHFHIAITIDTSQTTTRHPSAQIAGWSIYFNMMTKKVCWQLMFSQEISCFFRETLLSFLIKRSCLERSSSVAVMAGGRIFQSTGQYHHSMAGVKSRL